MPQIEDLKEKLILKIQNSEDYEHLKHVNDLLEFEDLYKTSVAQTESIEISRKQIAEGNFKTHDEVMKNAREWIKRK